MGGKKNKGYYKGGGGKKYKGAELQHGVVGFMFTYVRDRQRGAKAEAYELLNTYAAQFCEAAESSGQVAGSDTDNSSDDDCEDIDAALSKQVAKLKETKKSGDKFSYMDTGVNQVLFMKSMVDNHNQMTYTILDDALKCELKTKSRFLHRMLPVLATCRADMVKINDGIAKALEVYIASQEDSQSDITYKAEVKVRNNNDKELSRNNIISAIGSVVKEHYPEWKVDLSEPKVLIMIDILKKVCCISVVKDYSRYKKFNLQELAADFHTEKTLSAGDGRVKAANPKTDDGQTDNSKTNNAPDKVAEGCVQNDIPMTDSNLDQKQDSGPNAVTELKSVKSEDGESDPKRPRLTAEPVSEEGKCKSLKGEANKEVNNSGIPAGNEALLNTAGDS